MKAQPIIFFDGVCNLCNASVQFVIDRDKENYFKFTALQSDYAKEVLSNFDFNSSALNSILLLEDGKIYTKSSSVLRIVKKLNGFWPLLYSFYIVPKFLRDWVYDIIAKNRYKWCGKQENCRVPTPELKTKSYS